MVCRRSAHNVLLLGPLGAGKSMLARRLTTILPAMTLPEAIETTRIHRVAGLTGDRTELVTTRPCLAPDHTISKWGWWAAATAFRDACGDRTAPGLIEEVSPLLPIVRVIPWLDATSPRCVPGLGQAAEGPAAETIAPREFRRGPW
jgi:hypothetical protein